MEKLEVAVESHLVSDVPIGLTLSGGLDSSILAALISKKLKKDGNTDSFHAYTIGYGLESDEVPFAKLVCDKFKINHHVKIIDPLSALEDLPSIIWHLEEPLSNVTAITAYQWAKFMSVDLKVALIGEGADEVFGGYPQHRLFSGIIGATPFPVSKWVYRHAFLQAPLGFLGDLFAGGKEVRERIDDVYHQNYLESFKRRESSLKSVLGFDLEYQLPNNQLLRIDRMTMAHSLEARVPFLDHHLVESVWNWPDCWKINGSTQKYILRKAFAKILPKEILNRPKVGRKGTQSISSIVLSGLEKPLRTIIEEKKFKGLELFDVSVLRDVLDRKRNVSLILGDRSRAKLLYTVFMFLLWHRIYIESNSAKFEKIPLSAFLRI
jgi:asparagine synthase (glutamine-hydrolysing)